MNPYKVKKALFSSFPRTRESSFGHQVPGFRVMTAKKPAVMPGMTAFEIFAGPTVNRQLETVNFHIK